ncbi:hypothetical protein EXIGLDRAFT_743709 [Exidia glandulosa HHB12029]|uniref:Uncharacterized protein n=1 Tax=Exidia glandulosa HHB12029 TaxID=1314781 RepID=A0A165QVL6_EXIGL|nr:hypothetical protein EXIGLDRAFT_743709 [Exidia glandulosa HHB12029]
MRSACTLVLTLSAYALAALAAATPTDLAVDAKDYSAPHSYRRDYAFDEGSGWEDIGISDEQYKYSNETHVQPVTPRSRKAKASVLKGAVVHALNHSWNSLKGIGASTKVVITWYTGHDLLNPSCWARSGWAPTDESFACALTLSGWKTKPKCFSFLELCNGSDKCIFVRVVDTCAGCKAGSKHVDLTKAAFSALADLDTGILNVKMRAATEPNEWHEELWGPRDA